MTRNSFQIRLLNVALAAAMALGAGGFVRAQEPKPGDEEEAGPNPTELARQIRRNMLKIEDDLAKAGTHDASRGEQVKKDLEKLLDSMKQRQDQVIKDIDEIVKQIKIGNCNSGKEGQSDSNQNQKQSRARDRNKSQQGQGKPRDPNEAKKPGAKPKPKDGKEPQQKGKDGSKESDLGKSEDPGENQQGDPRGEPKPEKVARINLNEIWGNLPHELRQKLIDRNFDDFTPEYKEQIEEYFRKTGGTPK